MIPVFSNRFGMVSHTCWPLQNVRKMMTGGWSILQSMNCQHSVRASFIKTMDESMSGFCPQRHVQQVISHTCHVSCKNQKIWNWIQSCCMSHDRYPSLLGDSKRPWCHEAGSLFSWTWWHCRQCENGNADQGQQQLYLEGSWFASVAYTVKLWQYYNDQFLGIVVKTNHARFPKDFIETTLETWLAGSHIVLEGSASEGVDLLAVGYKYN